MSVEHADMGTAYVNERGMALAASLLLSLSVIGCATSSPNSLMDARAEASAPPKASAYLAVEDLPSDRKKPAMTIDERTKLMKELSAARDRQTSRVKARDGAAPKSVQP
jgi:hypothetical protein